MLVHIVDGDPADREAFAAVIGHLAPDVRIAAFADPAAGLAGCRERVPDLVVLDFALPGIDGHEYVRRFRMLPGTHAVPILMVTAAVDRAIRHLALEVGVADVLPKPIDRREMRARLSNLLASRRAHLNLEDRCRGLADQVREATQEIQRQADHDVLTGLPNRARFLRHLEASLAAAAESGEAIAVLQMDLDGFRNVNEVHGHGTGDAVLAEVGARLSGLLRPGEMVAHLGGDEFALLQAGVGQPTGAADLAERIRSAVRLPFAAGSSRTELDASIGMALGSDIEGRPEVLIHRADLALHHAKRDGKGALRFFEAEMDTQLQERRALEYDLRWALAESAFKVHYQPQADAATGEIVGFEALLRWTHAERGVVPPSVFIPLAEECGLIHALGAWVLRRACADAAAWPAPVRLGVNLSPLQIRPDLPRLVRDVLGETGFPAGRLEFEITEGVLIRDTRQAVAILSELKALGVGIALDDFGTGYSSLSYLQRFPFDRVKIDRSFVQGILQRPEAGAIIRAILGMTRSLGIATIAEGVETAQQLEALQRERCPEVQGFLIGKAMDADAARAFLSGGWEPATVRAPVHPGTVAAGPRRPREAAISAPAEVRQGAAHAPRLRFDAAHGARLDDGRPAAGPGPRLPEARAGKGDAAERADAMLVLLDASPAPVLVLDVHTQEVLWVNRSAVRFYGYEPAAFLKLRIGDFRVEKKPGEITATIPQAGTQEFDVEPRLHRTASGEHKIVKVTASRLAFDDREAMVVAVTDVTELHRMQEEVRQARNFLRQVIDQIPTAVFAKDMDNGGRFVIYNKASEALFGRSSADALGSTDSEVFGVDDAARFAVQDEVALRLGTIAIMEDESIGRPDGSVRHIRTRKVSLADGGRPRFIVGVCEDVTDRRATEARIAHMAHHDALTGLPNRFLFGDRLASALTRLEDDRETLAVLCIDLDGFKAVNDTWGHATGDRLLQAVADRLRDALRSCDTAARFGGDEFVVLQAPIGDLGEAGRLADRLIAALRSPYAVEDHDLVISASVGIAVAGSPADDPASLLEGADRALYRAKREGRNTSRFASLGLPRLVG